jgi:uncharacterized protein DUF1707
MSEPFRHPSGPLVPEPLELRASDAERERVAEALREHARLGRLDDEELEERLGLAYAAARRSELAALFEDLPDLDEHPGSRAAAATPPATFGPEFMPERHGYAAAWSAFASGAVVLIVLWAISGAGAFWPAWILVFWALAIAMRGRNRRRRR